MSKATWKTALLGFVATWLLSSVTLSSCLTRSRLPLPPFELSTENCPWNKHSPVKADLDVGFWMGACGRTERCADGQHIIAFNLGTVGKPSDACGGPVSVLRWCQKHNTGSRLGYFQGVCSDGTTLTAFKVNGAHHTTQVLLHAGFAAVNATNAGGCCSVAGFLNVGVTHSRYMEYSCPVGQKIVGYIVGEQQLYDAKIQAAVPNEFVDITYIGLFCQ